MCSSHRQENGSGLRNVERIERTAERNFKPLRTTLGDAWAKSFLLTSENHDGGKVEGRAEGIQRGIFGSTAAGSVDGEAFLFSLVKRPGEIYRLADGKFLQSTGRRAECCRAKVDAVVLGQEKARGTERVHGPCERAGVAGILYLVERVAGRF